MKIPKTIRRYNPILRKHTVHKVLQVKKRQPSSLKRGSKYRARRRGQARGVGGHGKYSKPAVTKFKRTGAKTTKKTNLVFECSESKKKFSQGTGMRTKRVELV